MYNVCHHCGQYRADKVIDPVGPFAICPECGYKHPFRRLPLLVVSGASGSGKSAVCNALLGRLEDAIPLDGDILWRPEFDRPETGYRAFFETWLRLAKNIGQAGRPVVIFGAGFGVPENIEPCVERRYFAEIHYLALICANDELAQRLRARPAWRGSGETPFIEAQLDFNRWFQTKGVNHTGLTLLDTTDNSIEQTVIRVKSWIRDKIISL